MNQQNKEHSIESSISSPLPSSKYFLSNRDFIWTVNKIESYDEKNRPVGPAIRNLALGDRIEYIDPELSYDENKKFIKSFVVPVIEITFTEVLISRPNIRVSMGFGKRYLLGNYSKFIDYHPIKFEKTKFEKINEYLKEHSVFVICIMFILMSAIVVIALQ